MAPIRVLVVDDAVVVRRMVSDVLAADPDIEVVGSAANGRIALAKLPQVNPDLVTLDMEMPEMDGLQTLAVLRKTYPLLPVIMFSTMTQRGGVATLNALALGANDYVTKPANVGGVAAALQQVREQLIPKIKSICRRAPAAPAPRPSAATWREAVVKPSAARVTPATYSELQMRQPTFPGTVLRPAVSVAAPRSRVDAVAIGVSTGGPNALACVIPALPADFPVPVLIVQHMPPLFTRLLAERLASKSPLDIREGTAGEVVRAGQVRIAPGDYHMTVQRGTAGACVRLHQGPPENSCRPAVDVLFHSVVEVYGAGVLGVVMTGMGQDGLRGAEAIREAGGQVIVQDEASSVVWGMPGYVARAGLAEEILPLDDLARAIHRLTAFGRTRPPRA